MTAADFEQAIGQAFTIETGSGQIALELSEVNRIASSPREVWLFTVPGAHCSADATSSTDRSQ